MNLHNKQILIENSLSSYNKQYLLEFDGDESFMKKCMENPDIPIFQTGLIQMGDTPNRNGRIYPFSILRAECERYLNEEIADKQSWSELDHPESDLVPKLKNAAATLEDIWFDGNKVFGRVKILNAFMPQSAPGLIVRGLILNNKTVGISSRALGSTTKDRNGYDVVEDDLGIICWDLVSRPSTIGANLMLKESLKKEEIGCLLESANGQLKLKRSIERSVKLTASEKMYLNILGVEKYLQLNGFKK